MKMSGGVEWALHCAFALTAADRPVPAARLAEMHDVSPTYLAKQLQSLSRAGLIHSVQGHAAVQRPLDAPGHLHGHTLLDSDSPCPSNVPDKCYPSFRRQSCAW